MRAEFGHSELAGAIGGGAVVCGAAAGPLWATVLDLASSFATAGIAAHAVEKMARERGLSGKRILSRAARGAVRQKGAPLASYALDVLCRARVGDPHLLRATAMLVGRATTAHARGIALQLFGSWCAPLRELTKLGAPLAAARAALENVELVRSMVNAVPGASDRAWARETEAEAVACDRFVVTFGDALEETGNESSTDNWKEAA
jgi:hypothetical protein